jgi:rare lipoprotein A
MIRVLGKLGLLTLVAASIAGVVYIETSYTHRPSPYPNNPNTLIEAPEVEIQRWGIRDILSEPVVASWYGEWHHGKLMANGEPFDLEAATVAHKDLDLGTWVLLVYKDKAVVAEVTDRGPYIDGRDLDVSHGIAEKLGFVEDGVVELDMIIMETD